MKINQEIQYNRPRINNAPTFRGPVDTGLRFLATNQGVGANMTDVGFMVIPRILSDAQRGPAATVETARREASGTTNHSLIGVYGLASGAAIAGTMGLNKKFGIDANAIFAAPETIDILAENKAIQVKNNKNQIDYLKETLKNVKAYNPTALGSDNDGFVKLSDKTIDEVAKLMDDSINNKNLQFKEWKQRGTTNSLSVAVNRIISDTGAESKYILESSDKKIQSETKLRTLLEDIFKISKSFNNKEVQEAFQEQIKNNNGIKENNYIKKLSKFMKARSVAGFALATGIGMSIQPLNIYLTKKKTGSDGFVGVEGRSKDNSAEFKALKGIASVAFMGIVLATLGTGIKGFMDKMAFKGFWPSINQLKGIYGLTIVSRLLATRDKDELREALTKDTLGFLSWLVLGDIVNKIAADSMDKSVLNYKKGTEKTNIFKRTFNSTLKTRDEILVETLQKNGVTVNKGKDGSFVAKTFKDLLGELDKLNPEIKNKTKKQLKTLNKAQCAGYMFSGLVLGIGIPNLNIYVTNTLDKKRKAKMTANK